jgi:hypothetical protein
MLRETTWVKRFHQAFEIIWPFGAVLRFEWLRVSGSCSIALRKI